MEIVDVDLYPHLVEGAKEISWSVFIRVIIPFLRAVLS